MKENNLQALAKAIVTAQTGTNVKTKKTKDVKDMSFTRIAWNIVLDNNIEEEVLNELSALKVKIKLVTDFKCDPDDIFLYHDADKKGWLDYCTKHAISSGVKDRKGKYTYYEKTRTHTEEL